MNDIENNRVKAETALIEQIKARIAFHANEHRQTYEVGKGVMDYLARDLLADFRAAGGALLPVKPNGTNPASPVGAGPGRLKTRNCTVPQGVKSPKAWPWNWPTL